MKCEISVVYAVYQASKIEQHQSTAASTWWYGPQPHLSWVEMAVGLPEGLSYPGNPPHTNHFFTVLPLKDRRRAARSFFKISRLSSLFSCPSLSCLLIFLLFLMSANVHPNPCLIFSCSVCAGNVT